MFGALLYSSSSVSQPDAPGGLSGRVLGVLHPLQSVPQAEGGEPAAPDSGLGERTLVLFLGRSRVDSSSATAAAPAYGSSGLHDNTSGVVGIGVPRIAGVGGVGSAGPAVATDVGSARLVGSADVGPAGQAGAGTVRVEP